MKQIDRSPEKAFSLIEVMVFVAIMSMVFVSAVSYAIQSLYRMKVNEHKTKAIFYAEELKEWLASEHESDWLAFSAKATGGSYCVNSALNVETGLDALQSGTCPMNGITGLTPRIYRRTVILTRNTPTQVTANIAVAWNETAADGSVAVFSQGLDAIFTSY